MAQQLLLEGAAPATPGTGYVSLYVKADGLIYSKDDLGVETAFGAVGTKQIQEQTFQAFTTGGTLTAYTLTPSPAITAYAAGQSFFVTFAVASGAAPTLAISAVATPPNLVKQIAAGTYANIAANDIPAGHVSSVTLLSGTQVLVERLPANLAPATAWNDIVNGDFRIAQIGTSFAAPVNGAYDLDGWLNGNSSAAVFTVAQVTGSSVGKLARQVTITTIDATIAAGDAVNDVTRIEGSNIVKYVGNNFTIGFRAKFPVAGIHCVALRNSGSDRSYIAEINCTAANTWAPYSFTVIGGLTTAGTWNYTTGVGLSVSLAHVAGTTFQTAANAWNTGNFLATANQVNDCATVGNVWAIEDVTISLGNFVIPSNVSYEEELARCMRYAPVFNSISTTDHVSRGSITSTSAATISYEFVVKPRVPPTGIITSAVANFTLNEPSITTSVATAISFNVASEKSCAVAVTGTGTPYTPGRGALLFANTAGARIEFTGCRL